MGINIISCCHKCKVKVFHFRRKENMTIIPFYRNHQQCMRENPNNVETKDDQMQEEDWMEDYRDDNQIDEEQLSDVNKG